LTVARNAAEIVAPIVVATADVAPAAEAVAEDVAEVAPAAAAVAVSAAVDTAEAVAVTRKILCGAGALARVRQTLIRPGRDQTSRLFHFCYTRRGRCPTCQAEQLGRKP
jgi:hypothetical protein